MRIEEGYWHVEEYIPPVLDTPWTNLHQVAQAPGRTTDVHEYADPKRIAQDLAEGVRDAYERGDLSETLIGRLHELIDTVH